jgi:hypothetical protein
MTTALAPNPSTSATPPTAGTNLVSALQRANLQTLAPAFQKMGLGQFIRSMPTHLYAQAPAAAGADPWATAAAQSLYLPDDAKAETILTAYGRAGSGTVGPLTVVATTNSAPTAGNVMISPNGDLLFAAADAWTSVDVFYVPAKSDTYIETLSVASNAAVIPTALTALILKEAQSTVGTRTGNLVVLTPGSTPSTGQCCLNAAKTQVIFASADAVTQCQVKLGVVPAIDVNALLEAASTFI